MTCTHIRSLRAGLLLTTVPTFAIDVTGLDLEVRATGLNAPVAIANAGDNRIFVVLQAGQVVIYNPNTDRVLPDPFLDITNRVGSGGERGLLSLAFHPEYPRNGFFFVNYTDNSGDTVIARYSVSGNGNLADASSERILLQVAQPFANHNGGQLQFGPDGFLYVALGDGGSGNDPICAGQDPDVLLGKILRLDVDRNVNTAPFHAVPASNPFAGADGTRDEIWALGLRNPWRFSFDHQTGELYIADVGQSQREEFNVQPAASGGGENYGWKMMEGFRCTNNTGGCGFAIPGCDAAEYTPPAFDYSHQNGRCSITGGYVYRGSAIPQAVGGYFYGDFCTGEVWAAERRPNGSWQSNRLAPRTPNLTSFGEDDDGEIYLVSGGTLFQLTGPGGGGGGGGDGECPVELGDPTYCDECGPCAEGEGGCRGDDTCEDGLVCAENFGRRFGFGPNVDVCLTPGSLDPPPYLLSELTVDGDLSEIHVVAINDAEQVAGWADSGDGGGFASLAFRFTPPADLEVLDPLGNLSSRALAINEAGDVYGVTLNADGTAQTDVFLFRDDGGIDRLTRRKTALVRRSFELRDMNDDGMLAGSVARSSDGRLQPYVYTEDDGWIDLSPLDPRFRQASTSVELINDSGDLVLQRSRPGNGPNAFHETYLLHGDRLLEVGGFGRPIVMPGALDPSGRLVGTAVSQGDGEFHAYIFIPPRGRLIDLHPPAFESSSAVAVTARGIVGGVVDRIGEDDTIFTWDNRRERKFRIQARGPDFRVLLAEEGLSLLRIEDVRMNERLEFVGRMIVSPANPDILLQRWFYFSPATGIALIDDLLAAAGRSEPVLEVTDMNDRGTMVLRVDLGNSESVVILTPIEN